MGRNPPPHTLSSMWTEVLFHYCFHYGYVLLTEAFAANTRGSMGPQEKMPFFQIASGPILTGPIHSNNSQYDPVKFGWKKNTLLPPTTQMVFFTLATGLVTNLPSWGTDPLLAPLLRKNTIKHAVEEAQKQQKSESKHSNWPSYYVNHQFRWHRGGWFDCFCWGGG